jgi:hypothetical protein
MLVMISAKPMSVKGKVVHLKLVCPVITLLACALALISINAFASTQDRINQDIAQHKAIVVHVLVALADNNEQWIVPIAKALGNGADPKSNLYWGALYGVKTYFTKKAGWKLIQSSKPKNRKILERVILKKQFSRNSKPVNVYLIADAWSGRYIKQTIEQFLRYNAGKDIETIVITGKTLSAGGNAHLISYVGHNALMDFAGARNYMISNPQPAKHNPTNDAIVLACKSQPYFAPRLKALSANPVVVTTGLMAPEAYTLNAAIATWINGASVAEIRKASAKSYNTFQKSGLSAAKRLFAVK